MLKMREVVVADETVRKSSSNEESSLSKEICPQGPKATRMLITAIYNPLVRSLASIRVLPLLEIENCSLKKSCGQHNTPQLLSLKPASSRATFVQILGPTNHLTTRTGHLIPH